MSRPSALSAEGLRAHLLAGLRLLPILSVLFVGASSGRAYADVGAGVGAAPVVLTQPARPGNTYRLPGLYVVNTGSEPGTYAVRVQRLGDGGGPRSVPSSWVSVERQDIRLAGSEGTVVPLRLRIPADAAPGEYETDLVAGTVTTGGPGAALGASAATKLAFRVVGGSSSWPPSLPGWAYVAIASVVVLGAGVTAWRRSGFAIRFERRR